MATEAIPENFVDLSTTITTASTQDVNDPTPVNGEVKQDGLRPYTDNSSEVSVSGGSDTEAAKAETSRGQADDKGHVRSTSTVKPKSFKAVSVNKTFLAAKGTTGTQPLKAGDKAATGATSSPVIPLNSSAPRPRLVAKSGSGLRDSTPRTSTTVNGGKGGAAPDASAVWNKNRPAPPPEQKRITDEELKQQYGIHLATRLQSDDPSRQANWADIDEDDDDWAPESIEWTDGTKITLPQADEAAPVLVKPESHSVVSDSVVPSPKPISPVPSTSTPKTSGTSGGSGRGLVLKGVAEKPTLVAKPPGPPAPVKSPWAPLPPVEKVVPLAADLQQPQQPQHNRFIQRDPHAFESMPSFPAKEIAADDFSRSWRDGNHNNTNRELFNSQSGRYEPVNEARRGSSRNDIHSRQPALLQRPSNQDHPEPSAAFQTHRAGGQDNSYSRRRTSSNVSGGSGNLARRMSRGQELPPPHEIFTTRRGSLVAASETASSPRNYSPSGQPHGQRSHQQQWQTRASPVISHASPASAHVPLATPGIVPSQTQVVPLEDEVELQKKIMRESRELARKRRLEEEAREEAEKKERIRLKLEAMGPAPETKKNKKDTPKEEKAVPTQIQGRDTAAPTFPPPKPPVPGVAGEVKQYGQMKVHHPESVSGAPADLSSIDSSRLGGSDNRPNGLHSSHLPIEVETTTPGSQHPSGDTRQQSTWQKSAPSSQDRFPSWASPTPHTNQSKNVWGPPTNDRTLGNGTFNPELSRLPDIQTPSPSQMASTGPQPIGPIGPPQPNRANGYQGRGREQFPQRPAPIGPPQRQQTFSHQDSQRAQANAAWNSLPDKLSHEDGLLREEQERKDETSRELRPATAETPHAQPVFRDTWKQVSLSDDGTRSNIKAVSQTINEVTSSSQAITWKDYPSQLSQDEATESQLEHQESIRRQIETSGLRKEITQPAYHDTWRQVKVLDGVRGDILASTTINNSIPSTASPPIRGSRFFPHSKDVRLEDPTIPFTRPGSPSPPPPTMAGHPAYDGDVFRPHVSLPPPQIVVKLPPPKVLAPIGPPKPIASFAAAVAAPTSLSGTGVVPSGRLMNEASSRPAAGPITIGDWQDRINHLIGRKSSPPKTHALAVDSSSKHALEVSSGGHVSATVSLPTSSFGSTPEHNGAVESKPMAEECFEEQEMGSLPNIRVPNKAPEAAWHLAPHPNKYPRKFAVSNITSADPITFSPQVTNNGSNIYIMLPGMADVKCVNVPHKHEPPQKSNGRKSGQSRAGVPRHASSIHSRGGRQRDPSIGFPSPNSDPSPASPSPNPSSRGGARGRGSYGSHWNNHRHNSTTSNAINV